ncbi:NAD(P)-dependent alcohol dehydrogenase [Patulibacter brassicae]|uniref:NAD(P)-dependent alcohol dehydrogenase n=1 Tax=Patulibacter brassicae TaxID=1705717 RepID=A0ABU4VF20_9ACTN|nr:NAD(P)-dependent alcohol dehydrogenase [Patulibacter brassicae]MDX8150399.1 NAD(P)-dependent alcohol dehydrogenase [Patulibacter brassicae]
MSPNPENPRVKATAAVLREIDAPLSIEEIELTDLQDDEVLVEIKGAGICHTDATAIDGTVPLPLPTVLGHEGAGVVSAVGADVTNVAPGDHVVLSFGHCRECDICTGGRPAYCELFAPLNYFGTRLDGTTTLQKGEEEIHGNWFQQSSFASHAIAKAANTVKVPDDVPIQLLGPLGCGIQTGAGTVLKVLRAREGDGIAIFGLGGVGLSALMAAKAVGCDPIVAVDTVASRLELATELGATHVFDPTATKDLVWDIMQVSAPGLNLSFDTVGTETVVRQCLEVLRSPGHAATVGFQGLENNIQIDQGHLMLGRTLSGVIEGDADPQEFIPEMVRMHQEGRFPFDRLIETFPFERINDAFAASHEGRVIKPVVVFD